MSLELFLADIRTQGWRLHSLSSYPGAIPRELLWGCSIRVSDIIYGHSINQPSAQRALEAALIDAARKEQWRPTPLPPRRPFEHRPTLDSIFS